jgi:hypothetical protein
MAPLPDTDASVGHSFGLEFDGVLISMVLEVFGLTLQRDVVEMKETGPDGKYHVRRVPGRPSPTEVVIESLTLEHEGASPG